MSQTLYRAKIYPIMLLSLFILLLGYSPDNLSITFGKTSLTKPITGYAPYIRSIISLEDTTQLNSQLRAERTYKNPSVGSILYIESLPCNETQIEIETLEPSQDPKPFAYGDRDLDDCRVDNNSLRWYILDPQEKSWNDIQNWDDLAQTEITNEAFPDSILQPDPRLSTLTTMLRIPQAAVGKRIGFTFVPMSKTGNPAQGSVIKVWDLDYYYGQSEQDIAGKVRIDYGKKIEKSDAFTGGGMVLDTQIPPEINQLRLTGKYYLNESLKAEYELVANTQLSYSESSTFWWGEAGTTRDKAKNNDASGTPSNLSPPLTQSDIATIYEVSVKPSILIQDKNSPNTPIQIFGEIKTQSALDDGNDLEGFQPFTAPAIEQLRLTGLFAVGKSLTAEYIFIPNTTREYSEQTQFWWGKAGTTVALAESGETGSLSNISPILSATDVGEILEVTARPRILIENQYTLNGVLVTQRSDNENNEIIYPPSVSDLQIVNSTTNEAVELWEFAVNTKLYGRYRFNSPTGKSDQSTYSWQLSDQTILSSGNTENSRTTEIAILPEYSGKSLILNVTAKDSDNIVGEAVSKTSDSIYILPAVRELTLAYKLQDTTSTIVSPGDTISAQYEFIAGSNSVDNSNYAWVDSTKMTTLTEGTVNQSIPDLIIPEASLGSILRLTVTARDGNQKTGNSIYADSSKIQRYPQIDNIQLFYNDSADAIQFLKVGDSVSATYRFIPGSNNADQSSYLWINSLTGSAIVNAMTDAENSVIPKITVPEELVGGTLILTIRPADGDNLKGKEVSVETVNIANPPTINNLSFTYQNEATPLTVFREGMDIGAKYQFVAGSNAEDKSSFEWQIMPAGTVIKTGNIEQTGVLPSITIPASAVGNTIRLSVTPKDGLNSAGTAVSISTSAVLEKLIPPRIQNLQLNFPGQSTAPSELTVDMKIGASYQFISGTSKTDRSEYRWSITASNTTLYEGLVPPNGLPIPEITVPASAIGSTLTLTVTAKDDIGSVGNTETAVTSVVKDNTVIPPTISNLNFVYPGQPSPPASLKVEMKIAATYTFTAGSDTRDSSEYEWRVTNSNALLASGAVNNGLSQIPELTIPESAIGSTIKLTLNAKDGNGVNGNSLTETTSTVSSNIMPPSINNLSFTYPNQATPPNALREGMDLSAQYQFVAGSNVEDKSSFEWQTMPAGTTIKTGNIEQTGVVPSITIPASAVGNTIRLSVAPKDGLNSAGTPVAISTNTILDKLVLPSIQNLQLNFPGQSTAPSELKVDMKIGASYQFIGGTSKTDRSTYRWSITSNNSTVSEGTVPPNSSQIPEITVPASAIGSTLTLTVTAKDDIGLVGNTETAVTSIVKDNAVIPPTISNLILFYPGQPSTPASLKVGMKISATYYFSPGSDPQDRSEYEWRITSTNSLLVSGIMGGNLGQIPDMEIPPAAVGSTLKVTLNARDGNGVYGNSLTETTSVVNSSSAPQPQIRNLTFIYPGQAYPPSQLTAGMYIAGTYEFVAGENPFDRSEFEWRLFPVNEYSPGVITQSGRIPDLLLSDNTIGNTLRLTVKPIDGNGVRGNDAMIETPMIGSGKPISPSISNLVFTYPGLGFPPAQLQPGTLIGAQYQFIAGNDPIDNSEYEWRLLPSGNVQTGSVTAQGQIAPLNLSTNAVGNTLHLSVTAKDRSGNRGNTLSLSTGLIGGSNPPPPIPGIAPRIVEIDFFFPDLEGPPPTSYAGMRIAGFYQWKPGSSTVDRSLYEWRISPDQLISSGTIVQEFRVPPITLQADYMGRILRLTVTAADGNGNIGNKMSAVSSALGGPWYYHRE